MGVFDTYAGVQLKIGIPFQHNYEINDIVDSCVEDGVYVGNEGVVVIKHGMLIAKFDCLFDNYGDKLEVDL